MGGGGVAGQERQADRRLDVGEDLFRARPVRIEQRGELVGGRNPGLDQLGAGAGHDAQRGGVLGQWGRSAQPVGAQPQVLGDHVRVARVGLRPGDHLALPPGLDRVRLHRDHRVPGGEQRVDQPPVRALDRYRHVTGRAQLGQSADQAGERGRGVGDGERRDRATGWVEHAHRMGLRGPVDPDEEQRTYQRHVRRLPVGSRQNADGNPAGCRVVTDRRSPQQPSVVDHQPGQRSRGRQCHAAQEGRPTRAVTPAPTRFLPRRPS